MDVFDVLTDIAKRKKIFVCSGVNEADALTKAELDVSEKYHILLSDIKRLVGQFFKNTGVRRQNHSFS